MMNQRTDQKISPIVVAPHMLLPPTTREVVADAAFGSAWVNRTPRQVIRAGVNRSTPGEVCNDVIVKHDPPPVLIGIIPTSPPCGIRGILQVANKWQSTPLGLDGNTQKLDAVVDEDFPDDLDSAFIFRNAIGYKLSNGSRNDLYSR